MVKKKLKMRVGKNFKNIRVSLSVGSLISASLLKNAFKSVHLNCQVAKSSFFSRHLQGCTVFLRLGITFRGLAKVATFSTKLQTKHESQTYEKVSYEVRIRHFCQTLVMCSPLFFVWFMLFIFSSRIQILQL